MTKQEYMEENAERMTEGSAAAMEQVAESAFDAVIDAATDYGWPEPGIDCDAAITAETLDDFDNSRKHHWSEAGRREEYMAGEFNARYYDRVQIAKGQRRKSLLVIDLGDWRLALSL